MKMSNIIFKCLKYDGGIYDIEKILKKALYIVCFLSIVLNNIKIELTNVKITMSDKIIYLANTGVPCFVKILLALIFSIGIINMLFFRFEFKKVISLFYTVYDVSYFVLLLILLFRFIIEVLCVISNSYCLIKQNKYLFIITLGLLGYELIDFVYKENVLWLDNIEYKESTPYFDTNNKRINKNDIVIFYNRMYKISYGEIIGEDVKNEDYFLYEPDKKMVRFYISLKEAVKDEKGKIRIL